MALSIDVNLPRKHEAEFPDCCVVCGEYGPGSHVRLVTRTSNWMSWLFWWQGKWLTVKAPACSFCAWKLHALRFLSFFMTVALTLCALFFVWPYVKESVPDDLRRWAALGVVVVCLIPYILLEVFFAMPFDITADEKSIDYEFTSKDYAVNFAARNSNAAWVYIDDEPVFDTD